MTTTVLWWLIGSLAAVAIIWRYVLPAIRRARQYIRNVETCGYLPPPPTPRAVRFLVRFSKVLAFIQVGKVKIEGIENLDGLDGPTIVTPNHPHWADTVVMPIVMNRPARYMAARGVFTFAGGLGGLLVGPIGAFAADLEKGKGGPARDAAVKLTSEGQILVMFPEGWAYLDGITREFKKGSVRIVREAWPNRQDGLPDSNSPAIRQVSGQLDSQGSTAPGVLSIAPTRAHLSQRRNCSNRQADPDNGSAG